MSTLRSRLKEWVNGEVEKKLERVRFSSLPLRMRIGIVILSFSFSVGYGLPIVLMLVDGSHHRFAYGFFKGLTVYGLCWALGAVALSVAGKECVKYPSYFSARLLKKMFPKVF